MNQEIKSSSSMSLKERLQRMVWYRLLFLVGTGILLFATGMYLTIEVSNRKNLEENRKLFESAFLQVYDSSKSFLTGNELMETCRRCLLYDAAPLNLRYLLYNQNASSPVNADLILTDKGRNVIYNSFQNGEWNQYRKSFNRAVCDNTFAHAEKDVYLSVYYLSGMSSELVLATPVMIDGTPQGYVSLYLHGADWGTLLSVSNFEGVITDYAGRVIYSSRHSFIQDINRFVLNGHWTVMLDENRYEVSARSLLDGQVVVYSLVYDPPNRSLFLIGTLLILLSGAFWFLIARSMTAVMAAENAASVKTLISEMDIIENQGSALPGQSGYRRGICPGRKQDQSYVRQYPGTAPAEHRTDSVKTGGGDQPAYGSVQSALPVQYVGKSQERHAAGTAESRPADPQSNQDFALQH